MQDPSSDEEALQSCAFTVFVDVHGQFCGLHKPGGAPLAPELQERAVAVASERFSSLLTLLDRTDAMTDA